MTVLVTGAIGFIGFHVSTALLKRGEHVIGIDNINDYYDPQLKEARRSQLLNDNNFTFIQADVADRSAIEQVFAEHPSINRVIHLAAQAGVRYSLENPYTYIQSNILGHLVLLEACRQLTEFQHFVYASSSSVYGANTKIPFSTADQTDQPVSLYGAPKKSAELISRNYAHLYKIPQTGLRYFTVYGPWGRPDMAYFSFAKKIIAGDVIPVFNNGDMRRDFTYIDDIVEGTIACLDVPPTGDAGVSLTPIYNLGNNRAEDLMHFISVLEASLGKKAEIDFKPMQPGDVKETYADILPAQKAFGFKPKTTIEVGLPKFVSWYRDYYGA
jgi:UDP-glucuronate 4-epimerase